MDNTNYTTEHRKGQHLLSEERHEIEVRLKDGWTIYRIAKHLGRPYNTVKNEVKRGMVSLYNGKQHRYKADEGKKVYLENRFVIQIIAVWDFHFQSPFNIHIFRFKIKDAAQNLTYFRFVYCVLFFR